MLSSVFNDFIDKVIDSEDELGQSRGLCSFCLFARFCSHRVRRSKSVLYVTNKMGLLRSLLSGIMRKTQL